MPCIRAKLRGPRRDLTCRAAWLAAHIPQSLLAFVDNESKVAPHSSSLIQWPSLKHRDYCSARSARKISILWAPLMANPDFMRFSLGIFAREQTAAFLDKVVGWQ